MDERPATRKAALSVSTGVQHSAVLFDRHPLWLEAVEGVLQRVGIDVVGKATSPLGALALVGEHQPSLFLADIATNGEAPDGFACLRLAQERAPGIHCVVLSSRDDESSIDAALAAGARAYVLKTAHPDDLASAVRQAFDHSVYFPRATASTAGVVTTQRTRSGAAAELTNREREILSLVAEGHSNAQLARMLWVTEQTVKFHLSNVYRKLSVSNRTEAARWAQLNGLLSEPQQVQTTAA